MNGSRMYDQLQAKRRLFTKNLVPTITVNVVMSLLCRSIRHAAVSPVIIFSFTVACCSKVVMFQLLDNTSQKSRSTTTVHVILIRTYSVHSELVKNQVIISDIT